VKKGIDIGTGRRGNGGYRDREKRERRGGGIPLGKGSAFTKTPRSNDKSRKLNSGVTGKKKPIDTIEIFEHAIPRGS